MESATYIQRLITSYKYAAAEMLVPGIRNLAHIDLGPDVCSFGVVLLELCGRQHPLHAFQTRGMQEMHDARPIQLIAYSSRWPIPEDFQKVLEICLTYESTKSATAHPLSQHKGLATGRECVLQRLPNANEYETTLQELEGLRTQLFSAREDGAAATSATIKVLIGDP